MKRIDDRINHCHLTIEKSPRKQTEIVTAIA